MEPCYKLLKQQKHKEGLKDVGLGYILPTLPWGVDLTMCAQFVSTYDQKHKFGFIKMPNKKMNQVTTGFS